MAVEAEQYQDDQTWYGDSSTLCQQICCTIPCISYNNQPTNISSLPNILDELTEF